VVGNTKVIALSGPRPLLSGIFRVKGQQGMAFRFSSHWDISLYRRKLMDILRVTGFAVVASLILTHTALTQEKKIKHSDLPAAVKKTVAA
jgi:hypothetical protein